MLSHGPPSYSHDQGCFTPKPLSHNHHTPKPLSHNHHTPKPLSYKHRTPKPLSHKHRTPKPLSHNHLTPKPLSHKHRTPKPLSHNHVTTDRKQRWKENIISSYDAEVCFPRMENTDMDSTFQSIFSIVHHFLHLPHFTSMPTLLCSILHPCLFVP